MIAELVNAFIVFLVIMDPFSSLPTFLSLTKNMKNSARANAAKKAILVAALPIIFFTITGTWILDLLSISITSFKIAGGIVLALLGLELVMGFSFSKEKRNDALSAAVVIGIPLITGPAVITTSILFSKQIGILQTILPAMAALAVVWTILRASNIISRFLGKQGIEIVSRIMGLLLVAIGISFIQHGILG